MKQGNLKKTLKAHIKEQSLSEHQLETLLGIQQQESVPNKSTLTPYRWAASLAVVFMLAMGSFLYLSSPQYTLNERIGNEVAKNHIKLKPLEIQTSSIQVIRNYFTELDFSPVESTLLQGSNKVLIGGRYCSIQGITAAQLRLKDENTGKVQSLYQTIYDPEVFSNIPVIEEDNKPVTVYSKGLEVDIWVEKGLLFALTKETHKN